LDDAARHDPVAPDAEEPSPLGVGRRILPFIVIGPLGLVAAIFLSLWVSSADVRFSVVAHVETQWIAGESLALRAQWVSEQPTEIQDATGEVWVERGGVHYPSTALRSTPRTGILQGNIVVPALAVGPAQLHLRMRAEGIDEREEVLAIDVVSARPPRTPKPMLVGSNLQHGDDSDPQPAGMRIDVLPAGRWLIQFDNTVYVRVVHPDGRPHVGPVAVSLASGEFMGQRAKLGEPVSLAQGTTNALGVLALQGLLTSEVVRLEVHVLDAGDTTRVLHRRRVYLVTHSGGVRVDAAPTVLAPGDVALEVRGYGFSRTRPVYVDVHGPDGAWIGTLDPPFVGAEPPRPWTASGIDPGLLQLEAYHFTNAPGGSTALARLLVDAAPPTDPASLQSLLAFHRAHLDHARLDRTYDRGVEAKYLDALAERIRTPDEVAAAREFLLGTLPNAVYGPPLAVATRERDVAEVAAFKERWRLGIRWFLLGGGGVFLVVMMVVLMRDHVRALRRTATALERLEMLDAASAQAEVRRAARAGLVRGLIMVAIVAGGLVLTIAVLEKLFGAR